MENVSSIKLVMLCPPVSFLFFFFSQFLSSLSHGLLSFSQPSYQAKLSLLLVSFESNYYVIILSQYYKISSYQRLLPEKSCMILKGKQTGSCKNKYKNIHVTKSVIAVPRCLFIHFSLTNKNRGYLKMVYADINTMVKCARANLIRKYSKGNKRRQMDPAEITKQKASH